MQVPRHGRLIIGMVMQNGKKLLPAAATSSCRDTSYYRYVIKGEARLTPIYLNTGINYLFMTDTKYA